MSSKTLYIHAIYDTERLACAVADFIRPGEAIALSGTLGMGKSVFCRAFIRYLCGAETAVPSPTFSLIQEYDGKKGPIFHFDLYRLGSADELEAIGFYEACEDGIVLVEWPDRVGEEWPGITLRVSIESVQERDEESRYIHLAAEDPDLWKRLEENTVIKELSV